MEIPVVVIGGAVLAAAWLIVISVLRSKYGQSAELEVHALANEWDWEFNKQLENDGLLSPLTSSGNLDIKLNGSMPERTAARIQEARAEIAHDEGKPYRTFEFLMRPTTRHVHGEATMQWSLHGLISTRYPARISEYSWTAGGTGDAFTYQRATVLLLDLGPDVRMPWIKASRRTFQGLENAPTEANLATDINGQKWHIASRNEALADHVFTNLDIQACLGSFDDRLASVELGSHWMFVTCNRLNGNELQELRAFAQKMLAELPDDFVKFCSVPGRIPAEQYDSYVYSQQRKTA